MPIDISISPRFDGRRFQGYFGIMRRAFPTSIAELKRFQRMDVDTHPFGGEPYAFIAMPYSTDVVPTDVWSLAIDEVVRSHNLRPYRADHGRSPVELIEHLYQCILNAELVIADLTGSNVNVYYELGLSRALEKPAIQLLGEKTEPPFDVRGYRTIAYDRQNIAGLKKDLDQALEQTRSPR